MYRWDKDDELYTESEAWEIAREEVDYTEMEEVLQQDFDFEWIWKHLSEEARIELGARSADRYFRDYFIYVDDEEVVEETHD